MERIDALRAKHSFIKEVRGKGLIIAIEFHEPSEFKLKMAWKLLHKVDKVLFAQMIVTQMLSKHRILTQVAGHAMDVLKILPPLIIGEKEIALFVTALDNVLTDCRKFPGPMWELGNNFVRAAISSRRSSQAPLFRRKSQCYLWSSHRCRPSIFQSPAMDPNTVPLNPNRAPLYYSATLYRPPRDGRRLLSPYQVFGKLRVARERAHKDAGGNTADLLVRFK